MVVWIDAQLAPALAGWLRDACGVDAVAVRDLHLRDAEDSVIFQAAREAAAVVLTKGADFVSLLGRHGPPPQVVWLTCGNTTNRSLRALLLNAWPRVSRSSQMASRSSRSAGAPANSRCSRPRHFGTRPAAAFYGMPRLLNWALWLNTDLDQDSRITDTSIWPRHSSTSAT